MTKGDRHRWEPIESLVDCERLLVSLWRAIGAVDFESKKIIDLPKEWVGKSSSSPPDLF